MNDTKSMEHRKVWAEVSPMNSFMLVTGEKENTVATSERVKSFKTDEDSSIRLTEVSVFELKKEEFASVTVVLFRSCDRCSFCSV
ncbi:hypothetical protein L1887_36426 [Cichorium endivia]|nr:hypothetical protein L1887_36426 [Cichorium endivia]